MNISYIDTKEKLARHLRRVTISENEYSGPQGMPDTSALEKRFINFPFLKKRLSVHSEQSKAMILKNVQSVLNGGSFKAKFESISNKSADMLVADILACVAVMTDSETEMANAYNFLVLFYNPYPENMKERVSKSAMLIMPKIFDLSVFNSDELMDMLSDSFFSSMNYLIKRRAYDPFENQPLSYMLLTKTWIGRLTNEINKHYSRKKQSNTENRPNWELPSVGDDNGQDDSVSGSVMSNDEKIDFIASKLQGTRKGGSKSEIMILYAWYEWFKNEGSKGDIIGSIGNESEKVTEYLISKFPDMNKSTLRTYLSRLREKIYQMVKDRNNRKILGVPSEKIDKKDILKGTADISESSLRKAIRKIIMEAMDGRGR